MGIGNEVSKRGGYRPGAGRKPSIKTQLKRFEERHPEAYDALMEILYEKGLEGSSLDAQYVIDRIKGKPKASTDIQVSGLETLGANTVRQIFQIARGEVLELKEGNDAIQIEGTGEGSEQEVNGESEEGVNTRG